MQWLNQILQGNTLDVLKTLPSESVDCVITSPPYWALRAYGTEPQIWDADLNCEHEWGASNNIYLNLQAGNPEFQRRWRANASAQVSNGNFCQKCPAWRGELGLEPTFQLYIKHLCDIFDEIKRILKKTGTCWVNMGDTYSGSSNGKGDKTTTNRNKPETYKEIYKGQHAGKTFLLDKSLCQIPSRFAIEMSNRGWILRNELIWWKPNCMPSSVKDRFTVDFEKVFFFVKSKKYWFEQQHEAWTDDNKHDIKRAGKLIKYKGKHKEDLGNKGIVVGNPIQGRNMRSVWRITTHGFPEAHFATFPEKLIEPMIKAGCPEFVCNKCGKQREKIKIFNGEYEICGGKDSITAIKIHKVSPTSTLLTGKRKIIKELGYSNCGCNAGFSSGIVLDPFMGSGTTALVALKLNRQFIGIELKPEYIEMAYRRIKPYLEQKKLVDSNDTQIRA